MITDESARLARRDANILKYLPNVRRIGRCWHHFSDPEEFEGWAILALVTLLDKTPESSLNPAYVETAIRNDLRDVLDLAEAGKRIPKELIVSLSDPLGDDSSGEPMCYEDVVADPNALNAEALVISADEVKSILSVLPDRQRKIVIRHLGLDGYDPRTMAAVATSMRLSKITIRREYAAAMTTLREQFGVEDVATTLEVLHAA